MRITIPSRGRTSGITPAARMKEFLSGKSSSTLNRINNEAWSKPSTPAQRTYLKSNGLFDGKYYSRGRAGEVIGNDVRSSSASLGGIIGTIAALFFIVPIIKGAWESIDEASEYAIKELRARRKEAEARLEEIRAQRKEIEEGEVKK
ncbi:hypothetical protein FACS189487_08480 [Campylobacterota bacterium]|nr:hypothetical protein FACS189487_08480 [Campylobacterota bacterium]